MRTQIVAPSNAMRYIIYVHLRASEKIEAAKHSP